MSEQEFRYVAHSFTWKVEDYLVKVEPIKFNEFLDSPEFSVNDPLGLSNCGHFTLNLSPKGESEAPDYVGLYITNEGSEDVTVSYTLYMSDESGKNVNECEKENEVLGAKSGRGWPEFIAKSSIETNADKVLVSGSITVGCELKLRLPAIKADIGPGFGDEMYACLKRNVLTDLILVCGEQQFNCHKFMLASRSSVFNEMFENATKDSGDEINRKEVNIDHMEPHVMEKLLEFIYTNKVDLSEHARELFIAADRFNVMGLKKATECKFMNELAIDNVAEVLTLFDTYVCETEGFEDKAVKYAMRNLSAVMKTDAWQKVTTEAHLRLVKKAFAEVAAMQNSA